MRLREENMGMQKEISRFLSYAGQPALSRTWFAQVAGYALKRASGLE